jgi:hypothetical protein
MKSWLKVVVVTAALTLALSVGSTSADACVTEATCSSTNDYGAQLTGMDDVEYYDDGCLAQWDCNYDDGYTTRHIVPH